MNQRIVSTTDSHKLQKFRKMNWFLLILAGILEVGFTFSLAKAKDAIGTESYLWYCSFTVCVLLSMLLVMKVIQTLPLGTAYAIWTGIGAVGTVLVGVFVFKEPADFWRIFFIMTLIVSIIGLKVVSH